MLKAHITSAKWPGLATTPLERDDWRSLQVSWEDFTLGRIRCRKYESMMLEWLVMIESDECWGEPTHTHGVEDEVASTGVSIGLTDSSVRSWYTLTRILKLIYSHSFHGSSYGPWGPDAPRAEISLWLHIVSFNRKASLAFFQPTPCLISIRPTLPLSFSLHLSIPLPCGNLGPPISPQATVNVWHGGTGSQSPQKPACQCAMLGLK